MIKTMPAIAFGAVLLLGSDLVSAHAETSPAPTSAIHVPSQINGVGSEKAIPEISTLNTNGLPAADTAEYAQGLNENPDGWHFAYGPVHAAGNKSAVLAAKARNGSIILSCGSTGSIEMIFGMAGAYTETGLDDIADFSVGETSHNLRVRAAKNPKNAVETVYYATGMDVMGIIRTMASLKSPHQMPHVINISIKNRHLALPSPWPIENAQEMMGLCASWHNKHTSEIK